MNDLIKNITTPLSERAKSPFYGSFIVSWLIWNWRIIFVIVFTSKYNLGSQNLSDYIITNYLNYSNGWYNGLIIPLVITAVYILALPWLDYWILGYSEKIKRKKIDRKIEIGRRHNVDGNTYFDLKMEYEQLKGSVSIIEGDFKQEKLKVKEKENTINELKVIIEQKDYEITTLQATAKKYNVLSQRHDMSKVFQGRWRLVYTPRGTTEAIIEEVNIFNDTYRVIRNNSEFDKYKVKLFEYDPESERLSFVKYSINNNTSSIEQHCINELRIINKDLFEGSENEFTRVTYTRMGVNTNSAIE